jgi:hypothetical protein
MREVLADVHVLGVLPSSNDVVSPLVSETLGREENPCSLVCCRGISPLWESQMLHSTQPLL